MATNLDTSWLEKTITYEKCPRCTTGILDTRIPRSKIVKYLFFWIDLKRFKCNACGAKVYVRNKSNNNAVSV